VFVRGYRFRLPAFRAEPSSGGAIAAGYVSLRPPYERGVRLASRDDPAEILELHWFRDEETYHAKVGVPTAEIRGLKLEEFDSDVPIGYLWHLPRMPTPQFPRDHEAVRRLAGALIERLGPTLPPGFRLAADHGRILVLRGHDVLHSLDLAWALDGDDDTLEGCMFGLLDGVQDVIAEETAEPWPNTRPKLPWPSVHVRDGVLLLRFVDDEGLVVELDPIDLEEIRG